MSNELAIAAVTRTLRDLLTGIVSTDFSGLPDDTRPTAEIQVTTLPLDRVRNGNGNSAGNQINLFLYHTEPNAAWRNMDLPRQVRPGEAGFPPLALNLHYIITAYGQDDSELIGHVLLGSAMSILHDHPVLSREEVRDSLALSELDTQVDLVHVTTQPVPLDDISKLWTGFQSEYRLSVAYQASVVLIESRRPRRSPLPVLRRGSEDRGPVAVAGATPTLDGIKEIFDPDLEVRPPGGKPGAELGDTLVIAGTNLGGDDLTVRFHHPLLDDPVERAPHAGNTATELEVGIRFPDEEPEAPGTWPAGMYGLSIVVERARLPAWTTNQIAFALSPSITGIDPSSAAVGELPVDLEVRCIPQVRAEQRVALLVGDREILPDEIVTPPGDLTAETRLTFEINDLQPGDYVVRLRVDGVDSIPIDISATPPQFDANQTITITP